MIDKIKLDIINNITVTGEKNGLFLFLLFQQIRKQKIVKKKNNYFLTEAVNFFQSQRFRRVGRKGETNNILI